MRPYGAVHVVGPPGWRRLPPVTRALLVLPVFGYLLFVFLRRAIGFLVVDPVDVFKKLQIWRLLSYPLVETSILSLLFAILFIWTIAPELEMVFGSRSFALFLLACAAVAALVAMGAAVLLDPGFLKNGESALDVLAWRATGWGLTGLLTSIVIAWALLAPHRSELLFGVLPMSRTLFAVLATIVAAFSKLQTSLYLPQLLYVLGGIPVAWLWVRRGGRSLPFSLPRFMRRRRFRVVDEDKRFRYH